MDFMAIVTCVALSSCPFQGGKPLTTPFTASSEHECTSKIANLIVVYHYDPKKFHIECKRK